MHASVQQVKDWILKRHPQREDIPADLDLIDNRLIDSLSFVVSEERFFTPVG
ncbi:hypothetical protein QWJ26_15480 [Streptomyces sp. CSDS2]|uniref:hypothetical protein n=1 Tax=Streptomyces sp. CSDS2 TaxID=3055051 RepID=UPI0025B01A8D|nr:hypothetical protein [Streptomyces sp. CSDS2]MDN3261190.1 hypothetical protein [Streptomyces sp. CSDS2]